MADDEKTLLNRIISFAVVEAGRVLWQKKSSAQRKSLADDLRDCTASDFKRNDREHVAAALGARELNVTLGSIRGTVSTWRQVCDFRNSFESLHGREPELRILSGLAFEVRDGKGMSYREFAILCGMLSQIGDKKYPVRITREQIQRRMLGYRKEEIMRSELSKRTDGASPLSTRQIGYTVDKLHERRFFARARANERQTYYSIRHTQCELEAALIESKTYSQTFHAARRQKDVDFMARMKAAKAAIKVDTAIKVNNPPCSNHVHVASAGVCAGASAAVSAGVSTLIETPRIETLPKETYSIETLSTQTRANKPASDKGEKVFDKVIKPEKAAPPPAPPTLDEVKAFAANLYKPCPPPELADEWFKENGNNPAWAEHDWKQPCAKWILGAMDRAKRRAGQMKVNQR